MTTIEHRKITYVARKVTAEREVMIPKGCDRARIERVCTLAMLDAEREICRAFTIQTQGMGYASPKRERVDHDRTEEAPDLSERDVELLDILRMWKEVTPSRTRGVTLDLSAFAFSIQDVAFQRAMTEDLVLELFCNGLSDWCQLRGWGFQQKV